MNAVINFFSSNRWARLLAVYLSMIFCGIFFAFFMTVLVSALLTSDTAEFGGLGLVIATALLSYPAGTMLAVLFLKLKFGYQGSLLYGSISVIISAVVMGFLINILDESLNLGSSAIFSLYYLVIPLAGLTGYHFKTSKKRN